MTAPEKAAAAFVEMIHGACPRIDGRRFIVPVAHRDDPSYRAYRERIYCYELYHQLRLLEGTQGASAGSPLYALSGEIDKSGLNAVVENGTEKPDLVWHVPGEAHCNAVVVEVKAVVGLRLPGIQKDLETLAKFLTAEDRSYREGVFLLYGPPSRGPEVLLRRVREAGAGAFEGAGVPREAAMRIKVLLHPAQGDPVEDLGQLGW
jgi:hypothetical protein